MTQPDKPEFGANARWTHDGKIAVVVAVVKPDGNIHIMERVIDPPPMQASPLDIANAWNRAGGATA